VRYFRDKPGSMYLPLLDRMQPLSVLTPLFAELAIEPGCESCCIEGAECPHSRAFVVPSTRQLASGRLPASVEASSFLFSWIVIGVALLLHWKELQQLCVVVVLSLKAFLAVLATTLGSAAVLTAFCSGLLVRPRTVSPFYACRRFTFRRLVASLLATLWSDS